MEVEFVVCNEHDCNLDFTVENGTMRVKTCTICTEEAKDAGYEEGLDQGEWQ